MPWQFYAGVSVCALAVLGVTAWTGVQAMRLDEQQKTSQRSAITGDRTAR